MTKLKCNDCGNTEHFYRQAKVGIRFSTIEEMKDKKLNDDGEEFFEGEDEIDCDECNSMDISKIVDLERKDLEQLLLKHKTKIHFETLSEENDRYDEEFPIGLFINGYLYDTISTIDQDIIAFILEEHPYRNVMDYILVDDLED